jgi:DNA-binding NarL/FixJ family response regulator
MASVALQTRGHLCQAVDDLPQAVATIRRAHYDVVIAELAFLRTWRADPSHARGGSHAWPAVMVVTGRSSARRVIEAFRLGVTDYLPTPVSRSVLVDRTELALSKSRALTGVHQAEHWIRLWTHWLGLFEDLIGSPGPIALPSETVSSLSRLRGAPEQDRLALWRTRLSSREQQVLLALARGLRPRHIARTLGISIHTARAHVKAIMKKTGVHSQSELLDRFMETS